MLGRDQGKRASSSTALQAWLASKPLRVDDSGAGLVAGRAETRLRALYPGAMARYDTLRDRLDPIQAMRQITPLIITEQRLLDHDSGATDAGQSPAASTAASSPQGTSPAAGAARTRTASASGRPVSAATTVKPMTSTAGGGGAVLARPELHNTLVCGRSSGGPGGRGPARRCVAVLATALDRAQQAGIDPGGCARSPRSVSWLARSTPAKVLNFLVQHRTVTAADIVTSSVPTTLTTNPLPTELGLLRPGADPTVLSRHSRRTVILTRSTRARRQPPPARLMACPTRQ